MTGNEIFRQALTLLNYTDTNGAASPANNADVNKRALPLVNQIYADLWHIVTDDMFVPLASLNDEVKLPSAATRNVMPYGVAMLIAQTDGDGDNQALYASLYEQRRPAVRCASDRIVDKGPRIYF